jgi:hypothetical protein
MESPAKDWYGIFIGKELDKFLNTLVGIFILERKGEFNGNNILRNEVILETIKDFAQNGYASLPAEELRAYLSAINHRIEKMKKSSRPRREQDNERAISTKKRFKILERDKFTCQYCGRKAPEVVLHIDHIQPIAQQGKSDDNNLITACQDCNLGKKDRLIEFDLKTTEIHPQLSSNEQCN